MENRFEKIIQLRFGIKPEPKPEGKEPIDLAAYDWDQCIEDQIKQYGDEETAKKVCGAIKAMYGSKQEMDIEPNPCWEGYEPIGLKDDGSPNCVPVKEKMNVVKEGFPIPSPESNEEEDKYISRCISSISDEYDTDQAYAICKGKWDEK
jgi:hypothetical protein